MAVSTPARRSPLALVIFALALLGALLVVHLHLQKQAAFAHGCTGTEAFDAGAGLSGGSAEGCAEVTTGEWATFLGVDNVVWGLLFYVLVAALRLGYGATGNDRLRQASFAVVGVGFLYEVYLVYLQLAVIDAICVLCMASAALVTVLLILHAMEHSRARGAAPAGRTPSGALRPYLLIAAAFVVLLGADYALASGRGDEAPADVPATADATEPGATPGETPAAAPGAATQTCGVDLSYAPIDMERLTAGLPATGSADAPVSVVEVFDPNCPHCKTFYDLLHGDFAAAHPEVKFYYVPFPLWDFSLGQVAALRLAGDESPERFFALVDELFARQGGRGMTLDQVVVAGEVAGMNGPMLRQRLTDNLSLDPLIQEIVSHREFVVGAVTHDGQMSVPRLVVNGRFVAPDPQLGYTEECLDRVIAEAAGQSTAAPAAPAAAE